MRETAQMGRHDDEKQDKIDGDGQGDLDPGDLREPKPGKRSDE